jgi:hypothetical protein
MQRYFELDFNCKSIGLFASKSLIPSSHKYKLFSYIAKPVGDFIAYV